MTPNVGSVDRFTRLALAAILFTIAIFPTAIVSSDGARLVVGAAGVIPFVTGLFRFCPLYVLAGIRTCAASESRDSH